MRNLFNDVNENVYSVIGQNGAKNLIPYPYYDTVYEAHGITWTVNADGSVTADGTATENEQFILNNQLLDVVKEGTNLILTGCPSGGSQGTYKLFVDKYVSSYSNVVNDFGEGGQFEMPTGASRVRVGAVIFSGAKVSNLTFKPMLRLAADSDDTYQPYAKTNKELTNDIDDVYNTMGEMGVKNLIPYPYYRESGYSANGMTTTYDSDGVLTINKVAGSSIAYFSFINNDQDYCFKPNTKYKLLFELENANQLTIYLKYDDTEIVLINKKSTGKYVVNFTTPQTLQGRENLAMNAAASDTETNAKVKVMIMLASDTDETYQPYAMTNKQLTEKKADISDVPTALSDLTDDSTHRVVTDTEKSTWNGKASSSTTLAGYGITDAYTKTEVDTALSGKISSSEKGVSNGVAELDANGKIPSSQLPSYVDDTIEGYLYEGKWYSDSSHTHEVAGETEKIYVELSTNKTYRWSGSVFVEISESLALGETSSTAYRGDRGKEAYDHSQSDHSGVTPTFTEASTRANIATGESIATIFGKIKKFFTDLKTVAFSGSYNDLLDKPDLSGKADIATTLAGYGITDAYTKTEVDTSLTPVSFTCSLNSSINDVMQLNQNNYYIPATGEVKIQIFLWTEHDYLAVNDILNNMKLFTIPEQYRPDENKHFVAIVGVKDETVQSQLPYAYYSELYRINSSGEIQGRETLTEWGKKYNWVYLNVSYLIDKEE